jgi:hypothetical protein
MVVVTEAIMGAIMGGITAVITADIMVGMGIMEAMGGMATTDGMEDVVGAGEEATMGFLDSESMLLTTIVPVIGIIQWDSTSVRGGFTSSYFKNSKERSTLHLEFSPGGFL